MRTNTVKATLFEVVYRGFNCRTLLSSEVFRFLSFPFDSVQLSLSRQGIKIENFIKSVGRTVKPALQARRVLLLRVMNQPLCLSVISCGRERTGTGQCKPERQALRERLPFPFESSEYVLRINTFSSCSIVSPRRRRRSTWLSPRMASFPRFFPARHRSLAVPESSPRQPTDRNIPNKLLLLPLSASANPVEQLVNLPTADASPRLRIFEPPCRSPLQRSHNKLRSVMDIGFHDERITSASQGCARVF